MKRGCFVLVTCTAAACRLAQALDETIVEEVEAAQLGACGAEVCPMAMIQKKVSALGRPSFEASFMGEVSADGNSAALDEQGYRAVLAWKSKRQLSTFLRRLLKEMNLVVLNEDGFRDFSSGLTEHQDMNEIRSALQDQSSQPCSWVLKVDSKVANNSAADAPLTDEGYRSVANTRQAELLLKFAGRVAQSEGYQVVNMDGFRGLVGWYGCDKGLQSLERMREEIRNAATLPNSFVALQRPPNLAQVKAIVSPAAAGIGNSVSLDESGYRQVADKRNGEEMSRFIVRTLRQKGLQVMDEDRLNGMVPYYSGETSVQSFSALQAELAKMSKEDCSWLAPENEQNPGSDGKSAQLSEEGYRSVARLRSPLEMQYYVGRVVDHMGMEIVDTGGLSGFLPFYDCEKGSRTLAELRAEIRSAAKKVQSWVKPLDLAAVARRNEEDEHKKQETKDSTSTETSRAAAARRNEEDEHKKQESKDSTSTETSRAAADMFGKSSGKSDRLSDESSSSSSRHSERDSGSASVHETTSGRQDSRGAPDFSDRASTASESASHSSSSGARSSGSITESSTADRSSREGLSANNDEDDIVHSKAAHAARDEAEDSTDASSSTAKKTTSGSTERSASAQHETDDASSEVSDERNDVSAKRDATLEEPTTTEDQTSDKELGRMEERLDEAREREELAQTHKKLESFQGTGDTANEDHANAKSDPASNRHPKSSSSKSKACVNCDPDDDNNDSGNGSSGGSDDGINLKTSRSHSAAEESSSSSETKRKTSAKACENCGPNDNNNDTGSGSNNNGTDEKAEKSISLKTKDSRATSDESASSRTSTVEKHTKVCEDCGPDDNDNDDDNNGGLNNDIGDRDKNSGEKSAKSKGTHPTKTNLQQTEASSSKVGGTACQNCGPDDDDDDNNDAGSYNNRYDDSDTGSSTKVSLVSRSSHQHSKSPKHAAGQKKRKKVCRGCPLAGNNDNDDGQSDQRSHPEGKKIPHEESSRHESGAAKSNEDGDKAADQEDRSNVSEKTSASASNDNGSKARDQTTKEKAHLLQKQQKPRRGAHPKTAAAADKQPSQSLNLHAIDDQNQQVQRSSQRFDGGMQERLANDSIEEEHDQLDISAKPELTRSENHIVHDSSQVDAEKKSVTAKKHPAGGKKHHRH